MKLSFVAAVTIAAVAFSACSGGSTLTQTPPAGGSGGAAQAVGGSFSSRLQQAAHLQPPVAMRAESAVEETLSPDEAKAAAYCSQTGGHVYVRQAEYDTNGSHPLVLAGRKGFCQYTSPSDGSRIHVLLNTLYTTSPSLAALAYILKPPSGSCQGNPASCYCSLIGGSDQFGGSSGAGGSWVNLKSTDQDLETCIFPDMSSIDSWGLLYHTNGIIRGTDLTPLMRYQYPASHR